MRVSAEETDPGHRPDLVSRIEILLDGVVVDGVVTADEEQGFVLQYVRDALGKPIADRQRRTLFTAVRFGEVRIRRLDGREIEPREPRAPLGRTIGP